MDRAYAAGTSLTGPVRLNVGGKCLDWHNGPAPGTPADLWDCTGSGAQLWTHVPDGTLRIHAQCLEVAASTGTPSAVLLEPCRGSRRQQWRLAYPRSVTATAAGNVATTLVNPASRMCLAAPGWNPANGTPVLVRSCNGWRNQAWRLPAGPVVSGMAGKCLDDNLDRVVAGNKIVIFGCNGTAAQQWTAYPDGTLRVHRMVLDVVRLGAVRGIPAQLSACNGKLREQWHLIAHDAWGPAAERGGGTLPCRPRRRQDRRYPAADPGLRGRRPRDGVARFLTVPRQLGGS